MYSFEKGQRSMNPYVAGIFAGVLVIIPVVFTGDFPGISTVYARISEGFLRWIAPVHSAGLLFGGDNVHLNDWSSLFLGGILVGSLISSTVNGSFFIEAVPALWRSRFGSALMPRMTAAFVGGVLISFGAMMGGGGIVAHGMGGFTLLSVGSFVSLLSFCAGGMITARFIYGRN